MEQQKQFIVQIHAGTYGFEFKAMELFEAFDALVKASDTFKLDIDKRKAMHTLVEMDKRGTWCTTETHRYSIKISLEGEEKQ